MLVSRLKDDPESKYLCPACGRVERSDVEHMRSHTGRECASYLKGSIRCKTCDQEHSNIWLHDQLVHKTRTLVTYGQRKAWLQRKEGQNFACLGCDFAAPFPGTLKMHALRCTLRFPDLGQPESSGGTVNAPHTASATTFRPLSKQKRKRAQTENESNTDSDDDDDEYVDLATKRRAKTSTPRPSRSHAVTLSSTQSARGQHARSVPPSSSQACPLTPPTTPSWKKSSTSEQDTFGRYRAASAPSLNGPHRLQLSAGNELRLTAASDRVSYVQASQTQAAESSMSAQSQNAAGGLPLHRPCYPAGDVHAFIEDIPISDEIKKELFDALGTAGVETMEDLYTLMDLLRDKPEDVRDYFRPTQKDTVPVGFPAWIVLRFELLSMADEDVNAYNHNVDRNTAQHVADFKKKISHYMGPFAPVLCKLGFTTEEVQHRHLCALSLDERVELQQYTTESGLLTFIERLSFRRVLRLTNNEAPSSPFSSSSFGLSPSLKTFLSGLPGSYDANLKAFTRAGIETMDEVEELCASPPKDIQQALNLMINKDDGLQFPELRIVVKALRAKGADIPF
ncbi:hypothetical protein EIP91_011173 [Steccherinum ochraceum]|uniref:Uncharacterized protein n=1 Tax=Steccherinum ochraceum TaxID=92696 RepID=A0A4R0RYR0_9APHY|nr:hypothetical protein EIP91_011173 [Steccherinum ochraceum]